MSKTATGTVYSEPFAAAPWYTEKQQRRLRAEGHLNKFRASVYGPGQLFQQRGLSGCGGGIFVKERAVPRYGTVPSLVIMNITLPARYRQGFTGVELSGVCCSRVRVFSTREPDAGLHGCGCFPTGDPAVERGTTILNITHSTAEFRHPFLSGVVTLEILCRYVCMFDVGAAIFTAAYGLTRP